MVLSVAIHNRSDIRADPVDYSPASYRKAAYRQYILWAHGYLGRGKQTCSSLLCCVSNSEMVSLTYWKSIWDLESTEHYLSYKSDI